MKNRSLIIILAILIIPAVLYYVAGPQTKENIISSLASVGQKPKVLDFSSEMCLECQELDKVLNPIKPKYQDRIVFQKIPINSNDPNADKLVEKYNVNVVPTLVFMNKDGKVKRTVEGSLTKSQLEEYLNQLINE